VISFDLKTDHLAIPLGFNEHLAYDPDINLSIIFSSTLPATSPEESNSSPHFLFPRASLPYLLFFFVFVIANAVEAGVIVGIVVAVIVVVVLVSLLAVFRNKIFPHRREAAGRRLDSTTVMLPEPSETSESSQTWKMGDRSTTVTNIS